MKMGLLLIDRDGTVIEERNYLSAPEEVALLPGAAEGLKAFKAAGFRLVLVTNQSGIGRGYFTEERLAEIHARMNFLLIEQGVILDQVLYCPHLPQDGCACRKPNTALAQKALSDCDGEPGMIVVIGDKGVDIELGQRLGAATVLVRTGYGEEELKKGQISPDHVADNILDAARRLNIVPRGVPEGNGV